MNEAIIEEAINKIVEELKKLNTTMIDVKEELKDIRKGVGR